MKEQSFKCISRLILIQFEKIFSASITLNFCKLRLNMYKINQRILSHVIFIWDHGNALFMDVKDPRRGYVRALCPRAVLVHLKRGQTRHLRPS